MRPGGAHARRVARFGARRGSAGDGLLHRHIFRAVAPRQAPPPAGHANRRGAGPRRPHHWSARGSIPRAHPAEGVIGVNKPVRAPRKRSSAEAMALLTRARPASLDPGPSAELSATEISARYPAGAIPSPREAGPARAQRPARRAARPPSRRRWAVLAG